MRFSISVQMYPCPAEHAPFAQNILEWLTNAQIPCTNISQLRLGEEKILALFEGCVELDSEAGWSTAVRRLKKEIAIAFPLWYTKVTATSG